MCQETISTGRKNIATGNRFFPQLIVLIYEAVDFPFSYDAFIWLSISAGIFKLVARVVGLEGREHSDFWIKFVLVSSWADSELDSFLEEDIPYVALDVLVFVGDEDDEDMDRVIFSSESAGLTLPCVSFSSKSFFKLLPSFASSEFTFDSAIMVKVNDSDVFLPRAVFPSSLNGIPNSRVAHTSQLGLHDEPRGSWETLVFLASSMECHRWDLEIEDPGAIVFKLFVGTIRCGNRGDPRIFSRDDVWLVLASRRRAVQNTYVTIDLHIFHCDSLISRTRCIWNETI